MAEDEKDNAEAGKQTSQRSRSESRSKLDTCVRTRKSPCLRRMDKRQREGS